MTIRGEPQLHHKNPLSHTHKLQHSQSKASFQHPTHRFQPQANPSKPPMITNAQSSQDRLPPKQRNHIPPLSQDECSHEQPHSTIARRLPPKQRRPHISPLSQGHNSHDHPVAHQLPPKQRNPHMPPLSQGLSSHEHPHPPIARQLPPKQRNPHMSPLSQGQNSDEQQQQVETSLSYRQKRRLEQAKRNGPKRGKTRGLKYRQLEEKPFANIHNDMRRVVGDNADRFLCDVSSWVKEYCPLDSWNWARMDKTAKDRLKAKIKGKYNLPDFVDGESVDVALEFQCKSLYRGWRFRLKEQFYVGYTIHQAKANKPSDIDDAVWSWLVNVYWPNPKTEEISERNRMNRLSQKIKPANGALSTARIMYDIMKSPVVPLEDEQEPLPSYIKLYERLKRHKDGSWEPEAYDKYLQLEKIHANEIEANGVDHLSVREAFAMVHEERYGYVPGLGPGPRPPTTRRSGETSELRSEMEAREAALSKQIEELKASNDELRSSNESLKMANGDLRSDLELMRAEQIEREKKLREEMMELFSGCRR